MTAQELAEALKVSRRTIYRDIEADELRTFRVSRFKSLKLLDETFERSPSFDLSDYWKESTRHYEASKPRCSLKLLVAPNNLGVTRYLSEAYGAQVEPPDQQDWKPVTLSLGAMQEARMFVMAMGDRVEIIDPPELRDEVRKWLDVLLKHYDLDLA